MTRKRRKVSVPLKAKRLYVAGRPDLWSKPVVLAREMIKLRFYARSTSITDILGPVRRMVEMAIQNQRRSTQQQ